MGKKQEEREIRGRKRKGRVVEKEKGGEMSWRKRGG